MKTIVYPLTLILSASAAAAHSGAHIHPHLDSASWVPTIAGLLVIATSATILWVRK